MMFELQNACSQRKLYQQERWMKNLYFIWIRSSDFGKNLAIIKNSKPLGSVDYTFEVQYLYFTTKLNCDPKLKFKFNRDSCGSC